MHLGWHRERDPRADARMKHRVVVGHERRWPQRVLVGLILLLGLCGWLLAAALLTNRPASLLALIDPDEQRNALRIENAKLATELDQAKHDLDTIRGHGTFEKQSCEIDTQACAALRESVSGLQAESAQLREQLAFYRSVAAPGQAQIGVRIVRLSLSARPGDGTWGYELLLLQPARRNADVSGSYRMHIQGKLGNKPKTLTMRPTIVPSQAKPVFSFRTFGTLVGEIKLPDGFQPERVKVALKVDGIKGASSEVTESFDWSMLVAAAKE
tara:strand:- start:19085 stop:19894 length:810 start_codon:yes stop_codon:yes gene_type:complete